MLRRSNQEFKQTVLMITHNPEAAQIGDRILTMRDGKIIEQGMAGAAPAHSGSVVLPTH
jgi:putative ABC transport system ATP-binding protein